MKFFVLQTCNPFSGFGGWHMGNQSQDEVFLAAQEAVGAHRDSQGKICDSITITPLPLSKKSILNVVFFTFHFPSESAYEWTSCRGGEGVFSPSFCSAKLAPLMIPVSELTMFCS